MTSYRLHGLGSGKTSAEKEVYRIFTDKIITLRDYQLIIPANIIINVAFIHVPDSKLKLQNR